MGFRSLRVINEDRVDPGQGFGTHGHRDMEIITYILEGELEHKDSMGNGTRILPGQVQRMSAGTGVTHSEFNPSKKSPVHLLQIWILPEKAGLKPGYEQIEFAAELRKNKFCLVASGQPPKGVVKIHQDVRLYTSNLDKGKTLEVVPGKDRYTWVQIARGRVQMNDFLLEEGDGAAVTGLEPLKFTAEADSEFLLFDLS